MEGEGGVTVRKAEIDTSAPFRSVKEAVSLFGEKVLVGEIYATNKIKQMQKNASNENGDVPSKVGKVAAELEETKQSLQKAKEESMVMATCLSSLEEELQRTKKELQQLKERESEKQAMETEIEHLKFVEDSIDIEVKAETSDEGTEFQKKRYVTFANPPSLARVIVPPQGDAVLERHPSLRKKKKKPLIPLIGGLFSRKKSSSQVSSPRGLRA
ncbi:hypothetical protein LguiA_006843 [Lonicera macranthoides]